MVSDTVLVALFAALPPTILALATLVQSRKNYTKSAETGVKADSIIVKTDEIHTATNGNLAKMTEELTQAKLEVISLKELLQANHIIDKRSSVNVDPTKP